MGIFQLLRQQFAGHFSAVHLNSLKIEIRFIFMVVHSLFSLPCWFAV
jgi:hypothetical protein